MTPPPDAEEPEPITRRGLGWSRRLWVGLSVSAVGLVLAQLLAVRVDALSPIAVAVVLGIALGNSGRLPRGAEPGLEFAGSRLLRAGVVLLGFRLALGDVLALGVEMLAVVAAVVAVTLLFTYSLARRLGLSRQLALLTGTGYAICGASAVAAMREVIDADDDDAAFAIALVTLFGTASILLLPLAAAALDLSTTAFGQWAGASVHDVGQVVATAATGGSAALAVAVVVKLTRVLLLGPVVVGIGLLWRRRPATDEAASVITGSAVFDGLPAPVADDQRAPLLPLFVVGFVATATLRTLGVVPDDVLDVLRVAENWTFTAALVGLGAGVRIANLRRIGRPGVLLGLIAWLVVALVAYVGVLVVHELGGSMVTINGA